MNAMVTRCNKLIIFFLSCAFLLLLATAASADIVYQFERLWPALLQPWYFSFPEAVAIDANNNVYIADTGNNRIQKFTLDGFFITRWGAPGQFNQPRGIAVDSAGYVYVSDTGNNRVQKFSPDGLFIMVWDGSGTDHGRFDKPIGIATDSSGFIYVVDSEYHCIHKFNANGQRIITWGEEGSGNSQFESPEGIAVSADGFVYVADSQNSRIQKFDVNGNYITQWGTQGSGNDQFRRPSGITTDSSGNVYVSEKTLTHRIKKFDANGTYLSKWGAYGIADGMFQSPIGLGIDAAHNIYVVDNYNERVQKFTDSGQFITKWSPWGNSPAQFRYPVGIAINKTTGHVYVVDAQNNRVQKFTADGQYLLQWGSEGSAPGQFYLPARIAIDSSNNVYVSDTFNNRIQRFDADGNNPVQFTSGQFLSPYGIAFDSSFNFYVADQENHRIQKFDAAGAYLSQWGVSGIGDREFQLPTGIAIDHDDNIYVTELGNHRVQKFNADGVFLTKWGSTTVDTRCPPENPCLKPGAGDGEFDTPYGIAVDDENNVYVADELNNRIQKFDSNGSFLAKWGTKGSSPGQVYWPSDLAVQTGPGIKRILVSDTYNSRIQVFNEVSVSLNSKAIIVAGGGPYAGNNLWDTTRQCANFAYRALTFKGFDKNTIQYLSADIGLDLDGDGIPDVDNDAANTNLESAISSCSGAGDVVLYLVDHGGSGQFRMSGTETLSASELAGWLNALQASITGRIIVVYDACESGSFLNTLAGDNRIIITSTDIGENAYFLTQGSLSFSNLFWTQVLYGIDVAGSFSAAQSVLTMTGSIAYQHPQLDASADGIGNGADDFIKAQGVYIGTISSSTTADAPLIGSVSPAMTIDNTMSASLYADAVKSTHGIARVWAVIRPPDFQIGDNGKPIRELPSVDFTLVSGNEQSGFRYEGSWSGFTGTATAGTYQVAIYARDRVGNTAAPKMTSVSVTNPLYRRAIIVAGGAQSDALWPAIEQSSRLAYEALTGQGYTDNTIYFMSPVTFMAGIDFTPTPANLQDAITVCASSNTRDLVLYLVGAGDTGTFRITASETLYAPQLDAWLDTLQQTMPGPVTIVYDADKAGSFMPQLIPAQGRQRMVITSAAYNQSASFLSSGDISFSRFFWEQVLNGATLWDAFIHAGSAVFVLQAKHPASFSCLGQTPFLDDSGNGAGNETADGSLARTFAIGYGIMRGADEPVIGDVSPPRTLHGETSAEIWTQNVTATCAISRVWATITPPGFCASEAAEPDAITLTYNTGSSRYEGTYDGFNPSVSGTYAIAINAKDERNNTSLARETAVYQTTGPDIYEDDDTQARAHIIVLNAATSQEHSFHDAGDSDWVKFFGLEGEEYTVAVKDAGADCDAVIELYDENMTLLAGPADQTGAGGNEALTWTCPRDGIYYVQLRQNDPQVFGADTRYYLTVSNAAGIGPLMGALHGTITDSATHEPLSGVVVESSLGYSGISDGNGVYDMPHWEADRFTLTATRTGYLQYTDSTMSIGQRDYITKDIQLVALGSGGGHNKSSTTTTSTMPQQVTTTTSGVTTISTTSVPGGTTSSTTPQTSTTTTSIKRLCAAEYLLQDGHAQGLQTLRNFRDKKLAQTPAGISLISAYYNNREELTELMRSHPLLAVKTAHLLIALLPAIEAGTALNRNITITAAQYSAVLELLTDIEKLSSLKLRQAIETERGNYLTENAMREVGVHIIL